MAIDSRSNRLLCVCLIGHATGIASSPCHSNVQPHGLNVHACADTTVRVHHEASHSHSVSGPAPGSAVPHTVYTVGALTAPFSSICACGLEPLQAQVHAMGTCCQIRMRRRSVTCTTPRNDAAWGPCLVHGRMGPCMHACTQFTSVWGVVMRCRMPALCIALRKTCLPCEHLCMLEAVAAAGSE